MFSRRADWQAPINRISAATAARRARGDEILDLTISNPTKAGIAYPLEELADAMRRTSTAPYEPQALGIMQAREAVASHAGCDPDDIMITASTSEAYSFLFKLLTDPGDEVATAIPSYPLLEHLAAMELVSLRIFPLEFHRRWEMSPFAPAERTRAIAVVSPNNPTGSFVTTEELRALSGHGLPLIIDEVFRDYPLDGGSPGTSPSEILTFSLGGLSKSAGLPHYKLGWIRISGPESQRRDAMHALELIADNFLSVSTPVQQALPDLLRIGAGIRNAIHNRARANLQLMRDAVANDSSIRVLPVEGGWSAVLRLPAMTSDEDLALALIERGVVVQPGYFFDFPTDGYLVLSLLTPPDTFTEGIRRILES